MGEDSAKTTGCKLYASIKTCIKVERKIYTQSGICLVRSCRAHTLAAGHAKFANIG